MGGGGGRLKCYPSDLSMEGMEFPVLWLVLISYKGGGGGRGLFFKTSR